MGCFSIHKRKVKFYTNQTWYASLAKMWNIKIKREYYVTMFQNYVAKFLIKSFFEQHSSPLDSDFSLIVFFSKTSF